MSTPLKLLVGVVGVVAVGSLAIGLASPDGSVGDAAPVNQGPRATAPSPSTDEADEPADAPEPATGTGDDEPGPDLAPVSVAGTWPGAPKDVAVTGQDVDWCGAVTTTGADEARRVFGRRGVDAAACAAVSFVLDHRYSRLSLPRRTYRTSDFDDVMATLDPTTVSRVYRPRLASFVADHRSDRAGEQLGLVLFTGGSTPTGARHTVAGPGHVFYGDAFSTDGYRDRAAWINPTWSSVAIRVDRSMSRPRIEARLTASAAMPVWSTAQGADAMLTIPTRATFTLRQDGDTWRIDGWTISRGEASYAALSVR